MRYYKMTDAEGNLTAIGTGAGGTEISAEEYEALYAEISKKVELVAALIAGEIAEADIREDWREEIVRRAEASNAHADGYTQEILEAMSNAELEQILSGMGVSVNMTKANMVTLILALQSAQEAAP
ncbi:MAG: hypothetical protein ACI4V3_03585 [Faecousia sp.]